MCQLVSGVAGRSDGQLRLLHATLSIVNVLLSSRYANPTLPDRRRSSGDPGARHRHSRCPAAAQPANARPSGSRLHVENDAGTHRAGRPGRQHRYLRGRAARPRTTRRLAAKRQFCRGRSGAGALHGRLADTSPRTAPEARKLNCRPSRSTSISTGTPSVWGCCAANPRAAGSTQSLSSTTTLGLTTAVGTPWSPR